MSVGGTRVVVAAALGLALSAGLVAARWWAGGPPSTTSEQRKVSFRGEVIASVAERIVARPGGGQRVERTTTLESTGETTLLSVDLDDDGLAHTASYDRPGHRAVVLRPDGALVVDGVEVATLPRPVLVIDVLHRARTTTPTRVTLLEPSSAEWLPATALRRGPHLVVVDGDHDGDEIARALPEGPRLGPGAFAEGDAPPQRPWPPVEVGVAGLGSLRGMRLATPVRRRDPQAPPHPEHRERAAFIEVGAPEVVAFAGPLCRADPLETARLVGEAVRGRVDAGARAVPPGAVAMLRHGGDCDGAAALATAALRVCGHAARIVTGYRLVEPGPAARLVPHALAEVYPGTRDADERPRPWWRLDATVPALLESDDRFVAVADGPGGALTMGRVLGVVDASDLVDASADVGPDARP